MGREVPKAKAAALALLLVLAGAARAERSVDLSCQFIDPPARRQAWLGACHAFAAVGLLEAAHYRAYGRHIRLSEWDLVRGRTVLSGDCLGRFCSGGGTELSEGGWVEEDLAFALREGVSVWSGDEAFLRSYGRWGIAQEAWSKSIEAKERELGLCEAATGGAGAPCRKFRAGMPPRSAWRELFAEPQWRAGLAKLLGHDDAEAVKSRSEVRALVSGFTQAQSRFSGRDPALVRRIVGLSPDACAELGAGRLRAIVSRLAEGMPVAADLAVAGLARWGAADKHDDGKHAFLIVGYRESGGRYRLRTRNSWGGDNPELDETQLCRVLDATAVLTPAEAARRLARAKALEGERRSNAERWARARERLEALGRGGVIWSADLPALEAATPGAD